MIPADALRRALTPALLLSLACLSAAEQSSFSKLHAALEAARQKYHVPGMSVAVVKDGKVVYTDGFGLRDVQKGLRATPDTAYEIGSATKAFTALLTTQAAVDGKLSLTDSPSKYLPNFRLKDAEANSKITVGDLMTHDSGLPRTDLSWYSNAFTREELLQIVAQSEPTAKLGKKWQYQNLMFLATGMIDEKVYGKPYDALIRERYFQPLGMNRSSVTYDEFLATPERAVGYAGDAARSPLPVHRIDICAPAGAVGSTVKDMAKYLTMLLAEGQYEGKTLFSKEAIAETRKRRIAIMPGAPIAYGYGWMLHPLDQHPMVEHGGNIDGFNAEVALVPDAHIGAVVLTNISGSPLAAEAAETALREFLPKDPKAANQPVYVPKPGDEVPEAMLGEYRLEVAKIDLTFLRQGGKTFVVQSGQKVPMTLSGPGRYTVVGLPVTFTFAKDPKDPKKELVTLEQGGAKLPLSRKAPFQSPIPAEDLLAKAVEARGGAEALRRHRSEIVHYRGRMLSDAIDLGGIRYFRGEDSADYAVMYGLNRKFADVVSFTSSGRAGENASFAQPSVKSGPEASTEILMSNELADLEPKRWYKSIEVVRADKVGTEDVLVLRKTPLAGGAPIYDYISKSSFRLLRRESGPAKEDYEDFRTIDGITMPFRWTVTNSEDAKTVFEILSVRFDERVPEWMFRG